MNNHEHPRILDLGKVDSSSFFPESFPWRLSPEVENSNFSLDIFPGGVRPGVSTIIKYTIMKYTIMKYTNIKYTII